MRRKTVGSTIITLVTSACSLLLGIVFSLNMPLLSLVEEAAITPSLVKLIAADKKDYELRLAQCQRKVLESPQDANAYLELARVHKSRRLWEKAIQECTKAIALDGKLVAAYRCRGACHRDAEQYNQARQDYAQSLRLNSNDGWSWYGQALISDRLHQQQRALLELNEAIVLAPNEADLYAFRSFEFTKLNRKSEALNDSLKAIALDPKLANAYEARARVHRNQNTAQALMDYSYSIKLEPLWASRYLSRATVYSECRQFKQAINDCSVAIALDPTDAEPFRFRADLLGFTHRMHQSLEDRNTVVRLAPSVNAYTDRAETYLRLECDQKTVADCQTALKLAPNNWAYFLKSAALYNLKSYTEALSTASEGVQLYPDDANNLRIRGVCNGKLGNIQQALVDLRRALKLQAGTADAALTENDLAFWQFQECMQNGLNTINKWLTFKFV